MRVLKPTKQCFKNCRIYGFDIETHDDNREFLCASITYKKRYWFFTDKQQCIDFFKQSMFRGAIISATNLAFDFMGTFFEKTEIRQFNFCWRDSQLLSCRSYLKNNSFQISTDTHKSPITFIDTFNFAPVSVEKAGKLLGLPKGDKPSFCKDVWVKWSNRKEFIEMKEYNLQDSRISENLLVFLFKEFKRIGASLKITIGSTAMSLFRNKYLDNKYYQLPKDLLDYCFESYFGGNTHAYSRGKIENMYYYDFNSLYPSVMLNNFPDPNSYVMTVKSDIGIISNFEGVSDVSFSVGYIEYPILPLKVNNKLIFPIGEFRGKYTHLEIREAVKRGYIVKEIHSSLYFTETCRPFDDYVKDIYAERNKYAKEDPRNFVYKLLLNSLYGKFSQKYKKRVSIISNDCSLKELAKYDDVEDFGKDFFRVTKNDERPAVHCVPIWATYITAYARLKLFDKIELLKPVYVDTDSCITGVKVPTSDDLGALKLEKNIVEGVVVKPKFYMFDCDPKIKGLMRKTRLTINDQNIDFLDSVAFNLILKGHRVDFRKFAKFREAVRRGFVPNEMIDAHKVFDLEDQKRLWTSKFNPDTLQHSKPLYVDSDRFLWSYDVRYDDDLEQDVLCNFKSLEKNVKMKPLLVPSGDFFDSKGGDISKDEFFANETTI